LGYVVLGLTPDGLFPMGLASVFVVGLMIPLIDGPIMAILQGTVAPEMQGRVFNLIGSLFWITSPFSLAVAGPVSDWLGIQAWYVAAGVLCGVTGLVGFFIPAIVNIEQSGTENTTLKDNPQAKAC
jgi:DHA3 family macrolide efflux protein-like MFS transporter